MSNHAEALVLAGASFGAVPFHQEHQHPEQAVFADVPHSTAVDKHLTPSSLLAPSSFALHIIFLTKSSAAIQAV